MRTMRARPHSARRITSIRAGRRFDWGVTAIAFLLSVPLGYLVVRLALPVVHDRYFPWIVGRACGLSAYVALVVLVVFGMWLRHPWRQRFMWPHAEGQFRLHAALGMATVALVGAHIVSLVLDKYAGVSWLAVVVPGKAKYRPDAVTVGVFALYGLLAVTLTARFGGRAVGRQWLTVHRLALPTLALTWFHGVYGGADASRLRAFYLATGLLVVVVAATRVFGREPVPRTSADPAGSALPAQVAARQRVPAHARRALP
jgi:DMSO/TMAO reductase YedYZ heme-binding membrane subunit